MAIAGMAPEAVLGITAVLVGLVSHQIFRKDEPTV